MESLAIHTTAPIASLPWIALSSCCAVPHHRLVQAVDFHIEPARPTPTVRLRSLSSLSWWLHSQAAFKQGSERKWVQSLGNILPNFAARVLDCTCMVRHLGAVDSWSCKVCLCLVRSFSLGSRRLRASRTVWLAGRRLEAPPRRAPQAPIPALLENRVFVV